MMAYPVLHPPIPYADHHFTFNPQLRLSNRLNEMDSYSQPPSTVQTPSPELFTARETDQLLSFLHGFDRSETNHSQWDVKLEPIDHVVDFGAGINNVPHQRPQNLAPYSNPHLDLVPNPSARRKSFDMRSTPPSRMTRLSSRHHGIDQTMDMSSRGSMTRTPSAQFAHLNINDPSSSSYPPTRRSSMSSAAAAGTSHRALPELPPSRTKPLLSTPQKRLNHIMSEQKRRNAIRDGYAQLISLLAPAGSGPGLAMPTRGRPKGSGTKGKQAKGSESEGAKGKSGVLFRAVEYCQWLEEGRNALKEEVERVEAAAGILSL